jgi:hypothetical protein
MVGKVFTLKADTTNPHSPKLKAGTEVKVVMVSRFGDCGITTNLEAENGYSNRVMPYELALPLNVQYLTNVTDAPDYYRQMGIARTTAVQLSLAEIEQLHAEGKWE